MPFAVLCLVAHGRSGKYAHEVKMMSETIDLAGDISDRYRRNDERLVKVQAELVALQLGASAEGADPELETLHDQGNQLLRRLKTMKDEVASTSKRIDKIRSSMSVMLQLGEGGERVSGGVESRAGPSAPQPASAGVRPVRGQRKPTGALSLPPASAQRAVWLSDQSSEAASVHTWCSLCR